MYFAKDFHECADLMMIKELFTAAKVNETLRRFIERIVQRESTGVIGGDPGVKRRICKLPEMERCDVKFVSRADTGKIYGCVRRMEIIHLCGSLPRESRVMQVTLQRPGELPSDAEQFVY